MPQITFPPSVLQSWALEPDANAGAPKATTNARIGDMNLRTPASLHAVAKIGTWSALERCMHEM